MKQKEQTQIEYSTYTAEKTLTMYFPVIPLTFRKQMIILNTLILT